MSAHVPEPNAPSDAELELYIGVAVSCCDGNPAHAGVWFVRSIVGDYCGLVRTAEDVLLAEYSDIAVHRDNLEVSTRYD